MQFDVIVAPTIKALFIQKIESMILSGKLAVGDRLPSERELAEEMKVSKTVVHAGLKDLERKGFVYVNGRQGTFVANYAEHGTFETLSDILKYNGGRFDKENVASILELRKAVESITITKFASNHTDEDIAFLRGLIHDFEEMAASENHSYTQMAEKLFKFHHYICIKSQNLILPIVFNSFHDVSLVFFETSIRNNGFEQTVRHLENILELIQNGQGEEAVRYLSQQFEAYVNNI